MRFFSTIKVDYEKVVGFLGSHEAAINAYLSDAVTGAEDLLSVATAEGASASFLGVVKNVVDGLTNTKTTVTAVAGNTSGFANAVDIVTNLASSLLGDIGVKSAKTTAKVAVVLNKIDAAAGAIQAAIPASA